MSPRMRVSSTKVPNRYHANRSVQLQHEKPPATLASLRKLLTITQANVASNVTVCPTSERLQARIGVTYTAEVRRYCPNYPVTSESVSPGSVSVAAQAFSRRSAA